MGFLAASAWGDTDPFAGVESDNFSTPISQFVSTYGSTFDPTANNGVVGLYNDTGNIITSLTLDTTIAKYLTAADIADSFTCNSAGNPFFLHCGFGYNSSTGSLSIEFYGVNPSDADEFGGLADEIGEQEGIPPVVGACLVTPDAFPCNFVGHFAFVFNNAQSVEGNQGNGWVAGTLSSANDGKPLFSGSTGPKFSAPQFTVAPEPSTLPLLAGELLALCCLFWRRLRGLWSRR